MEEYKYGLNDKPTPIDMLLYGLQWFSITIPALIILSGIVAGMHYNSEGMMIIYLQKAFFITGLALILQIKFGHQMPIVIGPASVLLIGLMSTQSLSASASFTTIAIGGALIFLLSYSKIFSKVQRVFTTRVVIVTLMLVAIGMMPLIISLSKGTNGKEFFNLSFVLILTLIMVVANHYLKGIGKSLVILLGMILGSVAYTFMAGSDPIGSSSEYSWGLLFSNFFITPEFNISAFIAFSFCFLALLINELGSLQAVGAFLKVDRIEERCQKGVRVGGLLNTLSGMMGMIGSLNFSMSPGIIAATRAASKYPLILTGALLILCAVIPQSLSIFSYIPTVIMGSSMFYIMCIQLGAGFQLMVSKKAVIDFSTMITISFPIIVSIFISFAPTEYKDAIPGILQPVLSNGFVMGIISVLILDNLLCRDQKA